MGRGAVAELLGDEVDDSAGGTRSLEIRAGVASAQIVDKDHNLWFMGSYTENYEACRFTDVEAGFLGQGPASAGADRGFLPTNSG